MHGLSAVQERDIEPKPDTDGECSCTYFRISMDEKGNVLSSETWDGAKYVAARDGIPESTWNGAQEKVRKYVVEKVRQLGEAPEGDGNNSPQTNQGKPAKKQD